MVSLSMSFLDDLGEKILKVAIPHPINNHRPVALQSRGLVIFLGVVLVAQIVTNFISGSSKILGFATNISAAEIIRLTNVERSSAGLSSLSQNSSLNKGAALKAENMFEKDYWAHFAPDGTSPWYFFGLVGYSYSTAGENLARDFSTSSGVVAAWMASPGHKANILNSNFTEIGVGVVDGNLSGEETTLVVQFFGKSVAGVVSVKSPTSNKTTAKAPEAQPAKLQTNVVVPQQDQSGKSLASNQKSEIVSGKTGSSPLEALFANASASQKVTVLLLIFMALLLIIDSVILFRKRHIRFGSHSFAHASVILLLVAANLLYGKGNII